MHLLFPKASKLTESVIGAAIEVHRDEGPGLIESIYEWCMMRELELRHQIRRTAISLLPLRPPVILLGSGSAGLG